MCVCVAEVCNTKCGSVFGVWAISANVTHFAVWWENVAVENWVEVRVRGDGYGDGSCAYGSL